ncbi:uncharacterized protein LOC107177788 [Citrus sinensis]|uniref:uncharacterized protein LOC107177788 n=1 Tax=Citrus sinensis TaxID=2711 RepID=UPI002277559A|nr:uncharacterized protein LOC107177788 [Citrus sinensis]
MCNSEFRDKSPEDALNYLDYIEEKAQHWDTVGYYESSSKPQSSPSDAGMHNLREDHDFQAKFASLARKVEALELKKNDHVPSYAKFLKDLCTVKKKHKVQKRAFLAEHVSSILSTNSALKYKDPGRPTISCTIGDHKIGHALLDLGASFNLLPYSVYQQLNLGELKPTSTTLLLANRSIKVPRGIIEDVNGLMNLSFGNMTLELNVFNMCKQSHHQEDDDNENEEIDLIEPIIEKHIQDENFTNSVLTGDDDQSNFENTVQPEEPNVEETPELELKPLPEELKYVYLGEQKTYLVVISSQLTHDQEGEMPCDWSSQDKKKFLTEVKSFYWDEPYLFKYCSDQIFRRCIQDD